MSCTIAELLARAGDPGGELRRDAEILLCHALGKTRSYLFAWPERDVADPALSRFEEALAARRRGTPVAYLTGTREFWSLELTVNDATLIPRPETERLVEIALALELPTAARVVDLGTGSGAIALALAAERPAWEICAVDTSAAALAVARGNGERLGLTSIRWLHGDWFAPLAGQSFDLVLANPPYLAEDDPHLGEGDLRFEPRGALVAEGGALAAVDAILAAAPAHLNAGAWLLFEHGCEQGPAVRTRLVARGFGDVQTWQDAAGLDRVGGGRLPAGGERETDREMANAD